MQADATTEGHLDLKHDWEFQVYRDEMSEREREQLCRPQESRPTTSKSVPTSGRIPVVLQVSQLGHIPAIKNSMYSIVDKENREWKRRCVHSFVSQLLSECPTGGSATSMQDYLQSRIASLPQDDNWKIICEINLTVTQVGKGDEGAVILLEPL